MRDNFSFSDFQFVFLKSFKTHSKNENYHFASQILELRESIAHY